jgi:hypothetical protein
MVEDLQGSQKKRLGKHFQLGHSPGAYAGNLRIEYVANVIAYLLQRPGVRPILNFGTLLFPTLLPLIWSTELVKESIQGCNTQWSQRDTS